MLFGDKILPYMDELLKDADVIDHCFKDASKPIKEKEQKRYDALCKELGL